MLFETKTFNIYYECFNALASAELSRISSELITDKYLRLQNNIIYYFNRLIVPKKLRNKNIASVLMSRVCFWADEHHIVIFNDVNPYGDLDLEQLKTFYKKYGFTEIIKDSNSLIRHPKDFAIIESNRKKEIWYEQLRKVAIDIEKIIQCNCNIFGNKKHKEKSGHFWNCNIHLKALEILEGIEKESNDDC